MHESNHNEILGKPKLRDILQNTRSIVFREKKRSEFKKDKENRILLQMKRDQRNKTTKLNV